MNPSGPFHQPIASPWNSPVPPNPPVSSFFWRAVNVRDRLKDLQQTLALAKSMKKELETLMVMRDGEGSLDDSDDKLSHSASVSGFLQLLEDRGINVESQIPLSAESANSLMSRLRFQLEPFRVVTDDSCPWEEKSAAVQLAERMQKSKRNKLWRKRKRKRIAEMLTKERDRFELADQEADEWRVREIAKDIAKRKVEKMEEVAKLKAKEERNKLESELELVLIVEKLQELRSLRIQKLKKQGHFLPKEDDKFLEKVQAAVEEEERQTILAADTGAAKDAIATAEESRKAILNPEPDSEDLTNEKSQTTENNPTSQDSESKNDGNLLKLTESDSGKQLPETQAFTGAYDSVGNLPIEFYHYYYGSNSDMGTLVEVRRAWDAYIRPGGSRIPGHWVQPPPPANETWASYLLTPK